MKIAILGGTFNPVHKGHLNIAGEVISRFGYRRILFVPANIPVHKTVESEVGSGHRLKMLELATAPYPDFVVEDCELRRGGTSYTIDTVRELSRTYPIEGKPGLIIGDDLVEDFRSWRDVDRLMELVDLIVAHRQSTENLDIGYPCRYVDNSLFPVSSSQIRRVLGSPGCPPERDAVREWLPKEVNDYIRRHDLYS